MLIAAKFEDEWRKVAAAAAAAAGVREMAGNWHDKTLRSAS
jgi:hypothetical protein